MLVENNNSEKNSTDKVLDIYSVQLASRFKRWCVAFIDNLMGYFFVFAKRYTKPIQLKVLALHFLL